MKILKKSILILAAAVLLIISSATIVVNAEEDEKGDVFHHKASSVDGDVTNWVYEKSQVTKNDIDIKEITYSIEGNTLSVTMEVYGSIQSSPKHAYTFYFNTSDSTYIFTWATTGVAIGYDWEYIQNPNSIDPTEIMNYMAQGTLTAEGSVLTGSIELRDSSTPTNVFGYAVEYYTDYSEITGLGNYEWWGDFWPDTYAPWYGIEPDDGMDDGLDDGDDGIDDGETSDENGDKDTPGFESIILIAAIGIALIILRRRK